MLVDFLNPIVSFIPYFRHLFLGILVTLVAWYSFPFFRLAHLALQNVNKDYIIFSYFHNFVTKSDQKPRTKNGMSETFDYKINANIQQSDVSQKKIEIICWNFYHLLFLAIASQLGAIDKLTSRNSMPIANPKFFVNLSTKSGFSFLTQLTADL